MIRGLKPSTVTKFIGKKTSANLTDGENGVLLSAKNLLIDQDQQLRRAPGYTLVKTVGGAGQNGHDFQRDVDQKQFVIVQAGGNIYAMNPDGSGQVTLSSGETGTHHFVQNSFALYSSDGYNAWRYVDKGGDLTRYKWGIAAPATAPAISISAGTLTLTYGRTYVYCYVSKYTDSLGIQRVSVSAPSPVSAHSGPIAAEVVELSDIIASTDVQVNYIWIFAVTDSPFNTSATYYFAAEIPNGQMSWGDTLIDSALDQTRLAPFDNNPAPAAPLLKVFQNRVVAVNGSLIQLSGYSEITLGIPEESWPTDLFFNLPSGKRTATCVDVMNAGTILCVGDGDFWYTYQGYDSSTFTEQDRVASPSAAGPLALCPTPFGLAFIANNRRLYLWKPGGEPTDISSDVALHLDGTYAMDDLDSASISKAVLRWYSYGVRNFLAIFCRTSDAPDANLNLIQLWSVAVKSGASSGMYFGTSTVYEQINGIFQTDKIPSNTLTAAFTVEVGNVPYIYCLDAAGNLYRFPDGFLDNGNPYSGVGQLAWMLPYEGKSNYIGLDLTTDRNDSISSFQIAAAAADAPDQSVAPVQLNVIQLPSPVNESPLAIRGQMNAPGCATGRFATAWIAFPSDSNEAVVRKMTLWSRPTAAGMP